MVIFGVPFGYVKASPELDLELECKIVICGFNGFAIDTFENNANLMTIIQHIIGHQSAR